MEEHEALAEIISQCSSMEEAVQALIKIAEDMDTLLREATHQVEKSNL